MPMETKKRILSMLLTAALLAAPLTACDTEDDKIDTQNTEATASGANTATKENSTVEALNAILQNEYTLQDFSALYPQYEIDAQSNMSINIIVPEFENVVYVFSGSLTDDISEYKMVSVNSGGDILLPEYLNKTFDEILSVEGTHASSVPSDDIVQHLYKYEFVYIYRENFYYYIRGFIHGNKLTSENIAMLRYDETHQRPW